MRIANGHFSTSMLHNLQGSNSKIADLMDRISSGSRVLRPSDDPIASVRLLLLDRDNKMLSQYQSNIGRLSNRLQQNEVHLDGMLKNVMSAHDMMLWAADGSNSPGDLNAMAGTLDQLRQNLAQAANATDSDGNYLFSGTRTDTPAVSYDPSQPVGQRYSFTGNNDKQQVVIGNGVTESANVSVDNLAEILNQLENTIELLQDPNVNVNDPGTRAQLVACMEAMNDGIGSISGKIAGQGGAQNTLTLMGDNHAALLVANGEAMNMVGELDFAAAMDQLNNYMVAVQATHMVYSRVMQLNPYDILRG